MQQRQPRLGDIVDDYCPRERRLTNHAVVAMIGEDIRLTRCTTCDAEHDYKHARIPKLRKKAELASGAPSSGLSVPRRVVPDIAPPMPVPVQLVESAPAAVEAASFHTDGPRPASDALALAAAALSGGTAADGAGPVEGVEEGPVHRQLIRAQLPRLEGQPPLITRQAPDFTIRQPTGRQNRFRFRPQQGGGGGGLSSHGGSSSRSGNANGNGNGAGNGRGGGPRPSGRPPISSRPGGRQGGRKRSK